MRALTLWACIMGRGEGYSGASCTGFRYLEPGEEPGLCHQRSVQSRSAGETKCPSQMYRVGDFEFGDDF